MNEFEKVISSMDFDFFGTGKHKIDASTFLYSQDAILLDVGQNKRHQLSSYSLSIIYQ